MNATNHFPKGLFCIVDKLNFDYLGPTLVGRFNTYEVDLSDWSLSLSDKNPCIWIKKSDLKDLTPAELVDNIGDVVRVMSWQNNTVLLFIDGKGDSLRPHLPRALPTFVSIDQDQQKIIIETDSPTAATLDILLSQLPRSQLAPYETNRPVVGNQ